MEAGRIVESRRGGKALAAQEEQGRFRRVKGQRLQLLVGEREHGGDRCRIMYDGIRVWKRPDGISNHGPGHLSPARPYIMTEEERILAGHITQGL